MEKVLIVDDNLINRKILANILQDCYDIVEASNGEEAMDILLNGSDTIIAVLLDIVMPGMGGFEVLKQIRSNPDLLGLPVIVQTQNTEEAFETRALKIGATDFVSKPYKSEVIKSRLENVINTRIMLNEINALGVDELTGLMNINQFYYEGTKWIEHYMDEEFDVIALDIVGFGNINDSKGVDGANKILVSIAARMKNWMEKEKFFASRVYADRFVMLVRRREEYLDDLISEADEITKEYQDSISVHIKFGIYEIVGHDEKLSIICGRAFSATSLIKDFYGNKYAYYDEKLHEQILFDEYINDEMENALKEEQFQIYFQPKYEIFTGGIVGAEALVRWIHPEKGMISPGRFIPIFEKNGFIVKLDQYVWDYTARFIAQRYKEEKKIVPISVNISRTDIESIDIVDVLDGIVKKYQISPELLHLEVTETAYIQDTERIIAVVSKLKDMGFMIEMDDFGSGYSSLNMLAKLPINIIKLDMKFIQEIENSQNAKTIIEYTIGLAKWMNLPVVAEGVETEEQLKLLKKLECNYVQGYIYAKPMPRDEFETVLSSSRAECEQKTNKELFIYDNGQKYKMLIFEDLEMNRSIMRSYFEETFSIVEAVNGRVGIDYLNEGHKFDIILLDIYMPQMNGYEVLKVIRENPALKNIPVLVISAGNAEENEKALEMGADAFVSKPFTAENIINKIRLLLHVENILDDISIWDLREMVDSAWLSHSYDEINIIHMETGKESVIKGDLLVDTDKSSGDIIPDEVLTKCKERLQNGNKRYIALKSGEYVLNTKIILFKQNHYLICFRVLLSGADEI